MFALPQCLQETWGSAYKASVAAASGDGCAERGSLAAGSVVERGKVGGVA